MASCVHFLVILCFLYICVLAQPGSSLFSFHPPLMMLAFGVFMTEGVLVFTPQSIWDASSTSKSRLLDYHWILNFVSSISAIIGFLVIYYNKNLNNVSHFLSYHGIVGLIAVLYACTQLSAGFSLKYHSYIVKFVKLKYSSLKRLHSVSGVLAYLSGISAIILSFYSNWFLRNSDWKIGVFIASLYLSIFIYCLRGIYHKYLNKFSLFK